MKRVTAILAVSVLTLGSVTAIAAPATVDFELQGQHEAIVPPQPTQSPGKVEVVELFWYGCPHCYEFEPYLERWLAKRPPHVVFTRVPAVFANNRLWLLHAQAFYTAQALGVLDRVHGPLFEAYHKVGRPLDTKERLAAFFVERGIPEADFERAWGSFGVQSKTRQAVALTERYGIDGVPAVVVNGKYRTSGSLTGTYANTLKVVDALVEQEQRALPPTPSTTDVGR
jgi:thiol:disulfide interchange protein DsbA